PGDHIVSCDDLYGGTYRLFEQIMSRYHIHAEYGAIGDTAGYERAMRPQTKLVWFATPTNPLIRLADINAIAQIAHAHHALLVVDTTFLSPYFQQPLALGADIVLHSTTKYINGHSDLIGGALILNDEAIYQQ